MGNKGGKELALVRSSPEDSYADGDEEYERAVARRWKINNGFFCSSNFLVTSLVIIVCVSYLQRFATIRSSSKITKKNWISSYRRQPLA